MARGSLLIRTRDFIRRLGLKKYACFDEAGV